MKLNVRFQEQNETFSGVHETDETIRVGFGNIETKTATNDYNLLANRPSINTVTLEGALTAKDLGLGNVYYDTTANWDIQRGLIAEEAAIYIYSDYTYIEDAAGNRIPVAGLKIGSGNHYLKDLPFVSDSMSRVIIEHVANSTIHVTASEKEFWNNKVSSYIDTENPERLVLSKLFYETNGVIVSG